MLSRHGYRKGVQVLDSSLHVRAEEDMRSNREDHAAPRRQPQSSPREHYRLAETYRELEAVCMTLLPAAAAMCHRYMYATFSSLSPFAHRLGRV